MRFAILHAPFFQNGRRHHLRRHPLAAALDLELGARLGGRGGQVRRADAHAERRAHGAAPDEVHLAALVVAPDSRGGESRGPRARKPTSLRVTPRCFCERSACVAR